jgi:hypothetical protein
MAHYLSLGFWFLPYVRYDKLFATFGKSMKLDFVVHIIHGNHIVVYKYCAL